MQCKASMMIILFSEIEKNEREQMKTIIFSYHFLAPLVAQ